MLDPFALPPSLANVFKPLGNRLGLVTLPLHAHEIIISFAVYNILFKAVSPAVSARLVPKYKSFDKRTRINWDAHVVSQIQQAVILSLVALELLDKKRGAGIGKSWQTRLWGYEGMTGLVQALASGYFAWDVQVSLQYMNVLGLDSLMHAAGWLAITLMGFRPFANYYGLNFMLFELSTPFLNNHWFFDKLGMTGSNAQLINGITLIVSFALSRLVWGTYQSILLYQDFLKAREFVPPIDAACESFRVSGMDAPMNCRIMPTWLAVTYVGGTTVLSILNFWWFNKMVAAVRKRFTPKEEGKPVDERDKKQR